MESLLRERAEIVRQMIAIVDGDYTNKTRLDAVKILGEFRATEAATVLVKNLELEDTIGFSTGMITPEALAARRLPVSVALIKIGTPAIPALVGRISATADARIANNCIAICVTMSGVECTQAHFKKALLEEKDEQRKSRLENAVKMAETVKPLW